jgi:hypothetical protein
MGKNNQNKIKIQRNCKITTMARGLVLKVVKVVQVFYSAIGDGIKRTQKWTIVGDGTL